MRALPYFAPDPAPLSAEIATYLVECEREGTHPATLYAYRRDLADFACFIEEATGRPFATGTLTTELVTEYRATWRIRCLAAATVNKRLAALRGFTRYALVVGWITVDLTRVMRAARLTPPPPRSLEPGEPERLLESCRRGGKPRDRAIVATMLYARLRVSEVCEALEAAVLSYARDPWVAQDTVAELWCEADTHRQLLRPVAMEFSIPLVITRGNANLSHMYTCVGSITERYLRMGQRTAIVYVGDHDPAGLDLSLHLKERLCEWHMPPQACSVERVAVTVAQIRDHDLLTRPPKPQDSRTAWYEEMLPDLGCVELDASAPPLLVEIVRGAIERVITDRAAWEENEQREQDERLRLRAFIREHSREVDGG
jgi:hypothetical protein